MKHYNITEKDGFNRVYYGLLDIIKESRNVFNNERKAIELLIMDFEDTMKDLSEVKDTKQLIDIFRHYLWDLNSENSDDGRYNKAVDYWINCILGEYKVFIEKIELEE